MRTLLLILLVFLSSCNLLSSGSGPENKKDMGPDTVDMVEMGIESSCSDSLKNGKETDLNCGGDCRPCTDNMSCLLDKDCASEICQDNICSPPRCNDGVKNGTESDLDCGGLCDSCAVGLGCVTSKDCDGVCQGDVCLDPNCVDSCGRECDELCQIGEDCLLDSDCVDGLECDGVVAGRCESDCMCIEPRTGWKRNISFIATSASTDFYAYVIVPDFVETESLVFEKDGVILSSEPAEKLGRFWVHIESVVDGENSFQLISDETKTPGVDMWKDQIGVFHKPGLTPLIGSALDLRTAVNIVPGEGRFGGASFFDGTAYALVTGNGVEALFPTFSISLWFRRAVVSEVWKPLIGRQATSTSNDDFALGDFRSGRLYACSRGTCAASLPIVDDTWTFVTMTYDGTTMRIYINGTLHTERAGPRAQSTAGNPMTIGGDIDNADGIVDKFFVGSIDEIRVSSEVKTAAAIELQYLSADPAFFVFGEKEEF